jgi:DNA-binding GntR family transcriptional regulator
MKNSPTMSDQSQAAPKSRGRPKGTGARRVYEGLREDILHLRLPPGANIEEASLEKRFEVSRTPVREALIRLASEGLVTLLPNRGAQVTTIDISDVPQFFEALDVCQRLVLRLSAHRRTPAQLDELRALNRRFAAAAKAHDAVAMSELNHDFHAVTARACGNRYIVALYEDLLSVGIRLARSAFETAMSDGEFDDGYYNEVVDHHNAMIDALTRRDPDGAEEIGRLHTELFRGRIVRALESNLGGAIDLTAVMSR